MKSVYRIIGQGSKSVDFLAGQVTEQGVILGQQNVTAACPKGQSGIQVLFDPWEGVLSRNLCP